MKIQKNKNKKILLPLMVGVLFLFVLLGTFLFLTYNQKPQDSVIPINDPVDTQFQSLDTKQSLIQDPTSQDAQATTKPDDNSITLTSAQTTTDVTVYTKLNNITSGSCNLKVTNGAKEYTVDAPIIYQPEFSSCAGFTVSKKQLNGAGSWNVLLSVENNQNILTKSIIIEVN